MVPPQIFWILPHRIFLSLFVWLNFLSDVLIKTAPIGLANRGRFYCRLGVLDELPGYRFTSIRRHFVALRNWSGGGGCPDNLPNATLRTGFSGFCRGANRCLCHFRIPSLLGLSKQGETAKAPIYDVFILTPPFSHKPKSCLICRKE